MNDCELPPPPPPPTQQNSLQDFIRLVIYLLCLSWIILYFFNMSVRFGTDSYIQINVVLVVYRNNC